MLSEIQTDADRDKNVALSVRLMRFGSEMIRYQIGRYFQRFDIRLVAIFESVCQGRCGWAELIICLHVSHFIPNL